MFKSEPTCHTIAHSLTSNRDVALATFIPFWRWWSTQNSSKSMGSTVAFRREQICLGPSRRAAFFLKFQLDTDCLIAAIVRTRRKEEEEEDLSWRRRQHSPELASDCLFRVERKENEEGEKEEEEEKGQGSKKKKRRKRRRMKKEKKAMTKKKTFKLAELSWRRQWHSSRRLQDCLFCNESPSLYPHPTTHPRKNKQTNKQTNKQDRLID